jgi:hypothetical protein
MGYDGKERTAILIAASIIAAIRLRGEPIKSSPKLHFTISESIELARQIWSRLERGE